MSALLRVLPLLALLASCDNRHNLHGHLVKEPAPAEIAGLYRLGPGSPDQAALKEMGYQTIDSTVTLRSDFTFSATAVPGCCVHGWDERVYPFSGGIFEFSGTWKIAKEGTTYGVALEIENLTGQGEKELSTADERIERKPPSSLHVDLMEGSPMDLGFSIFNGDFVHISYIRAPEVAP